MVITYFAHRDHFSTGPLPDVLKGVVGALVAPPSDAGWSLERARSPRKEASLATERLSMRHLREILRHKWVLGRSHREIARSVGVSSGTVSSTVSRARAVGLNWEAVVAMSDEALDERVNGPRGGGRTDRPLPDPAQMHVELRKVGVTLQLLHLEYLERHANGYRYTKFCGSSSKGGVSNQAA